MFNKKNKRIMNNKPMIISYHKRIEEEVASEVATMMVIEEESNNISINKMIETIRITHNSNKMIVQPSKSKMQMINNN